LAVLEKSIVGSLALDYPKFTVHVLDDGNREWVKDLCERVGARYIARPDNLDKKAGNHNYALARTHAPFIAVFDADFVPYRNFLWRTLGLFAEPDVGIVQTPQAFFNVDHFQNNLLLQNVMMDELRFFYNHIMPCRDAWGVAFYCGSAAVLRREAIETIGGIVGGLAIEDIVTSMAHNYGIFWLEQGADGKWAKHMIDESWSQAHAVTMVDLNKDGQMDLVTGKRYMAHNGHDPGEREPLGIYWYEFMRVDGGKTIEWVKHVVDYSTRTGGGMQIPVADLDGDGDLDFAVAGKSGLYLFENLGKR
jgi:hypothetical protein